MPAMHRLSLEKENLVVIYLPVWFLIKYYSVETLGNLKTLPQ